MFFDEDMNSAWLSRPGTWEFAPSYRLGAINSCEATPIWGFAQALIGPPASVIGLQPAGISLCKLVWTPELPKQV